MIHVLADKYLYKIADFFSDEVDLQLFDPAVPLQIPDKVNALLIRTVTKINPETFPTFPDNLEFIGTGSAGTDHVDIAHLRKHNITFANAAGCNARSVAEYVAVALLLWAEEKGIHLKEKTIGIIGVGHTGGAVEKLLQAMDIPTLAYDLPREKRDPHFTSAALDDTLQSSVLTFHTPLTKETSHPTFHWLDEEKLQNHSFKLVINASRGGVVDEQALLEACRSKKVHNYILDVWENEPVFNDEVAHHAFIKTPHIAGYSVQAKLNASKIIVEALCNHFSLHDDELITNLPKNISSPKDLPHFWSLPDLLTFYHPIKDYETRFNMLTGRSSSEKSKGFNHIRTQHPLRQELHLLHPPKSVLCTHPMSKSLFKPVQK